MNRRWINQDDIKAAIRANDGSASVPEIAAHIHKSTPAIRANVRSMVETERLVPLGVSKTGARCYGFPEGKEVR